MNDVAGCQEDGCWVSGEARGELFVLVRDRLQCLVREEPVSDAVEENELCRPDC